MKRKEPASAASGCPPFGRCMVGSPSAVIKVARPAGVPRTADPPYRVLLASGDLVCVEYERFADFGRSRGPPRSRLVQEWT